MNGSLDYSMLHDLVQRLDDLTRAYAALSWLSECSAEVPADRVGHVMMPLDASMTVLLADFRAFLDDRCGPSARGSPLG